MTHPLVNEVSPVSTISGASYHKHNPYMCSFRLSPTISCGGGGAEENTFLLSSHKSWQLTFQSGDAIVDKLPGSCWPLRGHRKLHNKNHQHFLDTPIFSLNPRPRITCSMKLIYCIHGCHGSNVSNDQLALKETSH